MRLLIANWDHDEHHVQAALPITGDVSLRFLDETTYHMAACSPEIFRAEGSKTYSVREGIPVLRLLPYAVVCIDFEVKRQVFTGESS
jgi:hypothetical protein